MPTLSPCPSPEVLENLFLGEATLQDVDALEAHVLNCHQCAVALRALKDEDVLVAAMRGAGNQPPAQASEAAEALIPWLKRLRPKDANETVALTVPGDPTASVVPTFDFLAPPQQPGELGRLEQYRVLRAIGVGGMGMVFLAEDTHLQRQHDRSDDPVRLRDAVEDAE